MSFSYREVSADEARELFADQPYKLELIQGLAEGKLDEYGNEGEAAAVISTYKQDTLRGPVPRTRMWSTRARSQPTRSS